MRDFLTFYPAEKGSGFRMDGYFVWCGSVIKENGLYYLFAARWPEEKTFPLGYLTDSEIVLAVTDDLTKPFRFEKVLITKRGGNKWDSAMAHNPFIFKDRDGYVLYYIGSPDGGIETRCIGYACSKSLTDGWVRSESALLLPPDANNPAVLREDDGSYLLYFRDGHGRVFAARAASYRGPFTVVGENLFPKGPVEDMYVYKEDGRYVMIAEDCVGTYTGRRKGGVRFLSADGVHWDEESAVPAYGFAVDYTDGSGLLLQRRERPFLLQDGERRFLFTTAKCGGPDQDTGGKTWNMVQELKFT